MINMEKSTEKQIQMLTDGMEYSLGYWAMLQRGLETRGIEKCHRPSTFRCAISVIEGQLCQKRKLVKRKECAIAAIRLLQAIQPE